ncbi:MAG: heterodisulfide reductase-related iron-sulfur binding cluster [Nitrospiraceae bacterium]
MKALTLIQPLDPASLEAETLRIYDICDGCRRCFNLCPSFNTLLNAIDDHESDVHKLTPAEHHRIVDECYYCKLCYNHCPYTPPHQYALDFPRLMVAWKQRLAGERGVSFRDRLLTKTDLLGAVHSRIAGLFNWAMGQAWARKMIERVLGVHAERHVLAYQSETLTRWWARRSKPASAAATPPKRKVALFASCLVNYQATDVGKATVQVLEKNGVEVVLPSQHCCGMPSFDIGDVDAIRRAAETSAKTFLPWIDQGYDIVIPVPSCSLMFKREYVELFADEPSKRLAAHTFDVSEYLMKLKRESALAMDFTASPGRVAYQVPCHLRDQNIGFKSKELMECAGARVEAIERCSGHDGSWSAKSEYFPLSMTIAKKAVRAIEQEPADIVASDCPLSGLQLDQAGATQHVKGRLTQHPIQIVRDAYGLPRE